MKHISIERAKILEESQSLFTSGFNHLHEEWILTNNTLSETNKESMLNDKHKDSDEFVKAVTQLYEARQTIERILNLNK